MSNEAFEPKLVGFLCNWCSYTGADLAGTRVDPQFVLKAFAEGADGVLISGCHPGDCHYQEGNYKALRRYKLLSKMLEQFGIEKERFRLEWVSASEGVKFQHVCNEFTEQIRKLGPLNLNGGQHERSQA